MTRINCGVNPCLLTDEHLLAEHREIKRIPRTVRKMRVEGIPGKFCLGEGHVKFFLDKHYYTYTRYLSILLECRRRGFSVQDYRLDWIIEVRDSRLWKPYLPTLLDREIVVRRIEERILSSKKPWFHYYGVPEPKEESVKRLREGY